MPISPGEFKDLPKKPETITLVASVDEMITLTPDFVLSHDNMDWEELKENLKDPKFRKRYFLKHRLNMLLKHQMNWEDADYRFFVNDAKEGE